MTPTERRAMEDALARSEERFRLAARATNDILWDLDVLAGTVAWNEAIRTVLGYVEVGSDSAWWKERIRVSARGIPT